MEIFKIQIPLSTNERTPKALAYNKDRSKEGMFPVTNELLELCDGAVKIFVKGTMESDGKINIKEIADWQDW